MRISLLTLSLASILGMGQLSAADASWEQVQAMLAARCTSCHGDTKQKGGLRLDSPEWLAKGSKEGVVVVAGEPTLSKIYTMAALPDDHEDRMPPKGERLTAEQLAILKQWITAGVKTAVLEKPTAKPEAVAVVVAKAKAPAVADSMAATPPTDMMQGDADTPTGSKVAGKSPAVAPPEAPIVPAPAAPEFAITALTAQNFIITTLPGGWLEVHAGHAKNGLSDTHIPLLGKIGPAVAFLDLSNSGITDRQLKVLNEFTNLQRLHLEHTPITDNGLTALANCLQLTYINLFATDIGDSGLAALRPLKQLSELYVWQSKVTPAGSAALKKALPDLEIINGPDDLPTMKMEAKKKKKK